ncbi:hypothetical protein K502DRAFT_150054 [Neoconidiobolus thromboides FSU 785]|nr:hypothetical protein K502DRAFT_150054 [Neoconidiobolus thromboides FSU 785]
MEGNSIINKKIVETLKLLITQEKDEEIQEKLERSNANNTNYLKKLGLLINNLKIFNTKIGLGGKLIVELNPLESGSKIGASIIKSGDVVALQSNVSKKKEKKDSESEELTGIIVKLTDTKVVVSIKNETLLDENGIWKVIQLANEVSYKR